MSFEEMKFLKEYANKFSVARLFEAVSIQRSERTYDIPFENGWIACVVKRLNKYDQVYYAVSACTHEGIFNANIINDNGGEKGFILCDTELDIVIACEVVRRFPGCIM